MENTTPYQNKDELVIAGIDPALRCTGFAIVTSSRQALKVVDCGVIRIPSKAPISECLRHLQGGIQEIISTYHPKTAALESGFFSRNAKTAMLLGHARGIVIANFATAEIPVYEYAPRHVKQSVCGYGQADKKQVADVLTRTTDIPRQNLALDATDALGVAWCHAHTLFSGAAINPPTPL